MKSFTGKMIRPVAVFLWRKIDRSGHDTCRLFRLDNGWRLSGAAILRDGGKPCHLEYEVAVNPAWKTRSVKVSGYMGRKSLDLHIASAGAAKWKLNGVLITSVNGCIDVDLGFTPATNLVALRRLALKVGERAEAPAAYLRFPEMRLVRLPQNYLRISPSKYEYESPSHGYSGTLQVLPIGAVSRYPGLFELIVSG